MTGPRLPEPLVRPASTFSGRSVEVLRAMVLDGRLAPGDRLNEVELAAALGISRGPLREAISRLASEGLLTSVPNRGAYVREFTVAELRELYEVRIALETHALRLAAREVGPDAVRGLRELLDDTDRCLSAERAYPHDLDFHRGFVTLSGNATLLEATTDVHRKIELARSRSGSAPTRARQALAEHEEIYGHLLHGRGEQAAEALTAHLRAGLDSALAAGTDRDGVSAAFARHP